MPKTNVYLHFDGNCAEAMHFYQETLGGKLSMMTHGQAMPDKASPELRDKIIHSALELDGGGMVMGADTMSDKESDKSGFTLALIYDDVADSHRVFDALSQGGKVKMPLTKTFFSEAYGELEDRYGTPWLINTGQ